MKIKQLFKLKYLFYVSFTPFLIVYILHYLFDIVVTNSVIPNFFRIWGGFFVAGSFFLLYFQALIEASKNKQWLHFWLTLLTMFYAWIYYIFFHEKGFNLAKKIRKPKPGLK